MVNHCRELDLKPQIYIHAMGALSIITIPINMLALYCIVRKSPKQMDIYKWYLFTYQSISTAFDWAYTILLLPVLFYPVPMGHTAAWLAEIFSIPTYGGFCFCASILGCLAAIILNLFGYRLNVIVPRAHALSLSKLGHAYMSVAVATFCIICVAIALIDTTADQADALSWVTREYTCAEPALSAPRLYIFLLHKMKRVVVLGAAGGVLIIFLCISSVILSFHFLPKNGQLSQKTKVMQRRFLYLCVQV
ncbi:unnamed protein product [Nippostrongylus brasiliensis]|uniref:G protein-coupled receptor n=1 Tax=Nippostrongylus brasiliensis TaxID=27835 RepID=A0A0N4XX02_NIPBR|nr:unnamed protein product [Nippostrongylus brasiliensis]